MSHLFKLSMICLMLAGCALSPEYKREQRAKADSAAVERCKSLGYAEDTPELRECAVRLIAAEPKHKIYPAALLMKQGQTNCSTFGSNVSCQSY